MALPRRRQSRIPEFDSLEEEAEFWNTYDLGEFEDELEPVELEVGSPFHYGITVRLERDAFHRLEAIANRRGVSIFAIAQQWVLEGLARAEAAEAAGPAGREANG